MFRRYSVRLGQVVIQMIWGGGVFRLPLHCTKQENPQCWGGLA